LGNCLINQYLFLSPFPLYLFKQKKKPSKDQGKTLTTLGFTDIFYCPWTVFIFPGRDLFAVDSSPRRALFPHSTVTLFARLRGLSTSFPRARAA